MRLLCALLAGVVLTACGGGSADMHSQQAGSGPVSADPTPGLQGIAAFADMAHKAICTDFKNRLVLIDGKQVFWDRAGNCPDMGYEQVLYGASPQEVLCSRADSIAGPQLACKDESARPLFDVILQNLDKDDLGIGFSHTVERISLLVPSGADVAFKVVDATNNSSIHTARNVVVKDAGAWAALWDEHAGTSRPLPAVDFSTSMVVGVFLGERPSGCYGTSISKVTRNANGIAVQHTDSMPGIAVLCAMYVPTPAALAVIDRSDLPVEFTTKIVPNR
jgi:hypothetical protein